MTAPRPSRRTPFQRVCAQVGHAVRDYRMIVDGDRLLVGLSGGEDSLILMHVLHYLQRRAPVRFEILAATVDMGFAGFDGPALSAYCATQGWQHELIRLDGVRLLEEKNTAKRPCALCSRLRRGKLHGAADRLACTKIVLGQQLDDLAVSLLMSLFRGNGIKTMGPHVAADAGSKRLIRPLCYVPKSLIHEAALSFGFPPIKSCPYGPLLEESGDRALLYRLLGDLEARFPSLRQNLLASLKHVEPEHLLDARFISALQGPGRLAGAPEPEEPNA
jgi:tRNA 2-thiocytidine biosynthesis protein TtcA